MGSVKRDLHKTEIVYDGMYRYEELGVRRILSDVYHLWNKETFRGDIEATVIRCDLDRALKSNALTPRQRQAIALYYFAQLTQAECASLLSIKQQSLANRLSNAISNLSTHMSGIVVARAQHVKSGDHLLQSEHLNTWDTNVLNNVSDWWSINDRVIKELIGIFPIVLNEPAADIKLTWILTDRQMRKRNREKEMLRPEVYPIRSNYGTMRSTEDGRKIKLLRNTN